MKILIIAPHPDDEVLGCGGTISKFTRAKNDAYLCIGTKTYQPEWSKIFISRRSREITKVNEILGIKKTFFLDFPTVKLDTVPQKEINEKLSEIVKIVNPDMVFIPFYGDLNKDHRILFEASLVALRPTVCKAKKILAYEVLSETEWGCFAPFSPNIFIDISKTFNTKIKAMKIYREEIKKYPHPRSLRVIKSLAEKRGSECNTKLAESFMLIREIL